MTNVGCCLSWFDTTHYQLWINRPKCINHNLTLNRLNWINDYTYRFSIQLFLGFLCFNISSRHPASKTWMGMVPTDHHLVTVNLFLHLHELGLVDWIDTFDTDGGSSLGHGKYIRYTDCVIVVDFSNHKSHYFKRNTWSRMLKHFKKCKWWNINLFTSVW